MEKTDRNREMEKAVKNLWSLLNDFEDYTEYGFVTGSREEFPGFNSIPEIPGAAEEGLQGTPAGRSGVSFSGAQPVEKGELLSGRVNSPAPENDSLDLVASEVERCEKCRLCRKRKKTVPGAGAVPAGVMVIGEGPGAEEDASGIPFVGAAGKYLDKWLSAISLDRNRNCFIGNIVKCRPPGNRDPLPDEIEACLPYLERQITLLKPQAILAVGRISGRIITGRDETLGRLRGKTYSYRGIPVIVTYHPSAVLRDRGYRPAVWEDLKLLKELIDRQADVR